MLVSFVTVQNSGSIEISSGGARRWPQQAVCDCRQPEFTGAGATQ